MRKGHISKSRTEWDRGFECLGHSNWTICSPLSLFWSAKFKFVSSLYWQANSYYPRGLIVRKEHISNSKLYETEGFECLGHSYWTICSPLSPAHSVLEFFQSMNDADLHIMMQGGEAIINEGRCANGDWRLRWPLYIYIYILVSPVGGSTGSCIVLLQFWFCWDWSVEQQQTKYHLRTRMDRLVKINALGLTFLCYNLTAQPVALPDILEILESFALQFRGKIE